MGFFPQRRRKQLRMSFKDSLKALEADIHFANDLASDHLRDFDGACLRMRLSYSPAAQLFLILFQWTDCHLAGAFGLLRILIYKAYDNGKRTMTVYERKASLKEFYGVIFPSLIQLQGGITVAEDWRQKDLCSTKYKSKDAINKSNISDTDVDRENECDICMEMNSRVVLPVCNHSMCIKCYQDWRTRSQSCPFCRGNLARVNSGDLWIYISSNEIDDLDSVMRENVNRLFMYIEKLPQALPDPIFTSYPQHW